MDLDGQQPTSAVDKPHPNGGPIVPRQIGLLQEMRLACFTAPAIISDQEFSLDLDRFQVDVPSE
jgi:hypothetical protein